MSNKLLLLLILGVVFFSACSDDDKDPNYDGTYKDSGLELSRDGMVLSGKSVALSGNTLTLGNVIPGEPALAIPVTITGNVVEGTSSNDFREVKVSGKIEEGKMNLTLAVKNKATDIEGTWAVGNLDAGIMATHFTFTTDKEKVKYDWISPVLTGHLFHAAPHDKNAKIEVKVTDRFGNVYTQTIENK